MNNKKFTTSDYIWMLGIMLLLIYGACSGNSSSKHTYSSSYNSGKSYSSSSSYRSTSSSKSSKGTYRSISSSKSSYKPSGSSSKSSSYSYKPSSSSSSKKYSTNSYDDGWEALAENDDVDYKRYYSDSEYAMGVDDAADDYDLDW